MTAPEENDSQSGKPEALTWHVDTERRLLFIHLNAGITDTELTKRVPMIWKNNPEIIWYNVIVEKNQHEATSSWSWNGLLTIAQEWQAYARGRNPGKHVAIVTENYWITQLVDKAFGTIFQGSNFKCFKHKEDATAWALEGPRQEE